MNFKDFDEYMTGRRKLKNHASYDSLSNKEKHLLYKISKNQLAQQNKDKVSKN